MSASLTITEVDSHVRQGEIETAYNICNETIALGGASAAFFTKRGHIHRLLFENGRAIGDFSTAVELSRFGIDSALRLEELLDPVLGLAQTLSESMEVVRAVAILERFVVPLAGVTHFSKVIFGMFELSKLRKTLWQYDRALLSLRTLLDVGLYMFDLELEVTRAALLCFKSEILRTLKKMKTQEVTNEDLIILAENLCKYGKPRLAMNVLRRLSPDFTNTSKALIVNFYSRLRLNSISHAVIELMAHYHEHRYDGEYIYCLSFGLLQLGEIDLATRYLRELPKTALQGRCLELLWTIEVHNGRKLDTITALVEDFISDTNHTTFARIYLTSLHVSGANRVAFGPPQSVGHARSSIPRTILQFWHVSPPEEIALLLEEWRRLNPGWTFYLLDEASARDFITRHFGASMGELYDFCHHAAMKSDFVRICYLLVHGGVYIDADDRCVQPADAFFKGFENAKFIASVSPNLPFYVRNGFICATPGHQILRTALDLMVSRIRQHKREQQKAYIWQVTGPGLLTSAVAQYMKHVVNQKECNDLALISEQCFHRFAVTPELDYKNTKDGNWRFA